LRQRNVGHSGLLVSELGLGCNNFGGRLDREASIEVIRAALELGVTLFDTADVYPMGRPGASEEILGKALGTERQNVVLATKFGLPMDADGTLKGGSRRYIITAVEASLRRLGSDWIDLYQFHKPDPGTPIEETLRALDDLIRQGKVRYVGCSNFTGWQAVEAHWIARELGSSAFVCAQEHYSLLARAIEKAVLPALSAYGLGLMPYFPLAGGLLTGKYRDTSPPAETGRLATNKALGNLFLTPHNLAIAAGYREFCAERGRTLTNLAFSWLLSREPVCSVTAGASSPAQLLANAAAVTWELSADELAEIDRLSGISPDPFAH